MAEFLVAFEYEEVEQRADNQANGTRYVSSTGAFIEAVDGEAALAWGREIAEAFFSKLHATGTPSWAELGYPIWIEEDPGESDWSHCLDFFPKVALGEHPDPSTMTTEAYVAWAEGASVDIQPGSEIS